MKTDRELLESAAKAIGYTWDKYGFEGDGNWWTGSAYLVDWNPIKNAADRYALAKKLKMCIDFEIMVVCLDVGLKSIDIDIGDDDLGIVRAAAAIGEAME